MSYQWRVVVDPKSGKVYTAGANGIGCNCNSAVTVVDPTSNALTAVAVGHLPNNMAIDSSTGRVYVATSDPYIDVISPANGYSVTTVPVNSSASGVSLDTSGRLLASLQSAQQIAVIDPNHGYSVVNVSVGGQPSAVSFDSNANLIVSVEPAASTAIVTFIDPSTLAVIKSIPINSAGDYLMTNSLLMQSYILSRAAGIASIFTD